MTHREYPPIGSVSKTDDTSAGAHEAEYRNPNWPNESEYEAEQIIMDALYTALDEIAAPYCYFGAIDGDGADYGFWPALESLEDDRRSGELAEYAEGYRLTMRHGRDRVDVPTLAIDVDERGTVTLYRLTIERAEIWSA
jgi:hypothetical protein